MQGIISESTSSYLNLLRWFSAILVMLDHVCTNYFVGISELEHVTFIDKVFYLLTFLGHNAVIVFFVLSGFFIGGGVYNDFINNKFSLKVYIVKRLTRLYLVLIPVLILSFIFQLVSLKIFGKMDESTNLIDFLGSLFFLQTLYTEPFARNEPLWSLAYEFWYYLLFPILMFIILEKRLIALCCFILILCFLTNDLILYFLIWFMGLVPVIYNKKNFNLKISVLLFVFTFLAYRIITIKYSPIYIEQSFIGDFVLALSIVLLINSLIHTNTNSKYFRFNKFMADSSYTLYLIHVPILYLMLSFFEKAKIINTNSIFIFILIITFILFSSYILSLITEYKTSILTKKLIKDVH